MSDAGKPNRKALGRGITDAIERDASQTSQLLSRVKPAPLRPSPRTDQTPTTHPPTTDQPPTSQLPTAPERNFARVPNSIALEAIPAGLFRGESKKLYDALYQRTRGAVVPRRMIRATKADVMGWADISHNTWKAHVRYLSDAGLLRVHYRRGDRDGADYEVLIPGEATLTRHSPTTDQPLTSHLAITSQNLGGDTNQNLGLVGESQTSDFQRTSDDGKTSFKTKDRSDDEPAAASTPSTPENRAFTGLLDVLSKVSTEITGKPSTAVDADRWRELGEVLATELRIAAGRTTVSSAPAFLAEHLRRRLWKKDKAQLAAEAGPENAPQGQQAQRAGDSKNCPDCFGTGMRYVNPETFEGGVVKCTHGQGK